MGPDTLPLEYGGTAAEVPVEVAAQQLPAWRQQVLQQGGELEAGEPAAAAAPQKQQQAAAGGVAAEVKALERQFLSLRHSGSTSELQLAL